MKDLYLITLSAIRIGPIIGGETNRIIDVASASTGMIGLHQNIDEAREYGIGEARRRWSITDGWSNHGAIVSAIPTQWQTPEGDHIMVTVRLREVQ